MKKYEDYEPISGLGVCMAVACTLGVGFLAGAFSENNVKPVDENKHTPEKISTQQILNTQISVKEKTKE